jgi:hypothetical protein
MRRAFLVWLALMAAETVHGILRRLFLVRIIGDLQARQLGVMLGSAILFGVAYGVEPWMSKRPAAPIAVGLLWVALTLLFEVSLGRALGLDWDRILQDYDLTRGGLMGFGLLFLGFTPALVRHLRRK